MKINDSKFIFIVLILFSLLVGIISLPYLSASLKGDSVVYDKVALGLIKENKYIHFNNEPMLIAPGYPAFLALIYTIFGHHYQAVYLCQFILLGGIGFFIFLLAKNHFKLPILQSLVIAITVICWPYLVLYSSLLLTEIFYIFFLIVFIYLIFSFAQKPSLKKSVLLGILSAIISLTRAVFLLLPLWILLLYWFFYIRKKKPLVSKNYLYHSAIIIIILTFLIFPWIIFSYHKTGHLTPVTGNMQILTNNIILNKYQNLTTNSSAKPPISEIITDKIKNIYRFWQSGAKGKQAKNLIKKNPPAKYLIIAYRSIYYAILFLFFLSLYYIKKKNIFLLWSVILYYWLVHIIFFPMPRYTLPIMPLVILLAFYTLFGWQQFPFVKNQQQI